MAARRTRPLRNPVTLTFDGDPIVAERGEPLAAALLAARVTTLARSPKFHRPRGPSCMRGACDGCLARVGEHPNVTTCLVPAEEGLEVHSQNYVGARDADLLRMTDWFFPEGLNHHELFAGVPGVQAIMQGFARRVAGLGKLPKDVVAPRPAERRRADVVVVGAGASGMAVALRAAEHGREVEVIDDRLELGGSTTALSGDEDDFGSLRDAFSKAAESGKVRMRPRTTAGALYGDDLLVVGDEGAEILTARELILACGAHDGMLAFEGNDLPFVMSARAAGWLLREGVLVGSRIVVVVAEGGGPFGATFAANAGTAATLVRGTPIAVRGTSRAKGVVVHTDQGERTFDADAVVIDAPRAPAFELCEQAGANLSHEPFGYVVQTDRGRIRQGIWATGEVIGLPLERKALEAHAESIIQQL